MAEGSHVLIALLVVFASGKLLGEVFERLHQPAVIGELIAGILIGPGMLAWVQPSETLSTVATMGVIVLMFAVGLETRPSELFKVGMRALVVGCVGIVLPMIAGFYFGKAMGFGTPEAIFIGTALVATSVGITARVLADRGFLSTTEARIILAAAVIDDVLGMLVLSFAIGSSRGDFNLTQMGILIVQVVLFIGFELWLAPIIVKRHGHWLDRLKIPNAGFVVALIVLLSMAALSEAIGLAGIVGAFFAGMMFAETEDRWELSRQTRPLYEWLVPYFFVVTGMQVQPSLFASPAVLIPGLILVALAVATKVVGCGLGAWGMGWKRMVAIGVGMVPRGEVGLIIAATGLSMKVIGDASYAMIILVVVLTTVIVPPLLAIVFPWATGATPHPVDIDTDEVIA
jgi:Kef-type K+ transport system membrane component KefB